MNIGKYKRIVSPLVIAGLLLVGLFLWLKGSPPTAHATPGDVYCVTPGGGAYPACDQVFTTIQAAVDAATGGEEIRVATGTYIGVQARPVSDDYPNPPASGLITQVVYISKTVTVRGGYTTPFTDPPDQEVNPATLDAQEQGRVIVITGDITPTIAGLRITGGDAAGLGGDPWQQTAGGGVYIVEAAAIISDSQVYSNTANYGGGLFLCNSDETVLSGNTILANNADVSGGGMCLWYSDATLNGNIVSGNTANDRGGGAYLYGGNAMLNGNTVSANTANDRGGGVYLVRSGATLSENVVISNTSGWGGGGLCLNDSNDTLAGNTISANTAGGWGGGLYLESSDATLSGNVVSANAASDRGGGLNVYLSAAAIHGNTIVSNTAADGGGLHLGWSDAALSGNTVATNTAVNGAGVYLDLSDATLDNNFVTDNTLSQTWGQGGGLYVEHSSPRLRHNTIARNITVGGQGEGLYVTGEASRPQLHNTILVSHSVGISVAGGGSARLEGTFWGGGAWANATDWSGNVTVGTVNVWGDPAFVAPDAGDYHIGSGSDAVDAGTYPTLDDDVDGESRPAAFGPDIGADERSGPGLWMVKWASHAVRSPGESVTYTVVITDVGTEPVDAVVLIDRLPSEQRIVASMASTGVCAPLAAPVWGGGITCTLGSLGVDASVRITLTAQVTTTLPPAFPWPTRNSAWVTGTQAAGFASADVHLQNCHVRLNDAPGEWDDVQAAVDASAQPTDVVKVAGYCAGVTSRAGTVQMVYLDKTLTLQGGWNTAFTQRDVVNYPTTLDALGQGRVFYVTGYITPTIEGLRVTGGDARAMDGLGGGACIRNATAIISDNQIYDNVASDGGGLYLRSSDAILNGNTASGNVARFGGGLFLNWSDASLSDNTVYGNVAVYGGGLRLDDSAAILSGNTVISNVSSYRGGGLYLDDSDATFNGNTIATNSAADDGGGLYLWSSDATLNGNTVSDNTGDRGGGLYMVNSVTTLSGNTISDNTADRGGGLRCERGIATLNGNTISDNTAVAGGGGLYLWENDAALSGNTVVSNTANWGGGLYLERSAATLTNTIVADNRANSAGAGLYTLRSSPRLLHSTIARNSGGDGSGVHVYYDSAVTLTNTILVSHVVGINVTADCTATLESTLWYSNTTNWDGVGTILTGTHNTWGNPLFDADGYHLLSGSAAIDAGMDAGVTTDVDSEIRPMGLGYDIGADEFFVCVPLSGVSISGPAHGFTDTLYTFTAVVTPPTATPPFTYTWSPEPESGQGTSSAGYRWPVTGTYTITLAAESCGGDSDVATHAITIEAREQHDVYLPLVLRNL